MSKANYAEVEREKVTISAIYYETNVNAVRVILSDGKELAMLTSVDATAGTSQLSNYKITGVIE